MDSSDSLKTHKRSPFDLIMNQIRRKKSFTERRQRPAVARFFRPVENDERKEGGIPEDVEGVCRGGKENAEPGTGGADTDNVDMYSVVGWGRVKQFTQKLGRKPDGQSLSLSHCDLTATDVVELATLMPFLTTVEEMDLSWNDLIGGSLKALTFHLQHVCKLRVLRLSGCRLTAQDLEALGEALQELFLLEVLDLSWNASIGGCLQHLFGHLQYSNRVKELHLMDCGLTAADAKVLGMALCGMHSLEVLDVSTNRLLGEGLTELTPQLKNVRGLRVLRLQACGLTPESLDVLSQAFQFLSTLEELDLSSNKGASRGLVQVAPHLGALMNLHSLDLHMCCLTEEDMHALNQVLPSLRNLTALDLSCNKETGGVCHSFIRSLPLARMKRLHLSNCCLSQDSYEALVVAMQQLPLLEGLSLSWNKCVGGNLGPLLEPLMVHTTLREMRLSSCGLTTDDLLHLASASKRGVLARMQQLDLSYNDGVAEGGWTSFFQELGGLVALVELDVSLRPSARGNPPTWLPALLAVAPHLPALRLLAMNRWVLGPRDRQALDTLSEHGGKGVCVEGDPPKGAATDERNS
ncbi:leucine-rich repeat-containing protein 31 [Scleropages formosus]|uniref:Leucine rich repeat containing 31 n=1 Tax=Scleropages formosus TaxID=113540 RepID=A0A8C9RI42_SCLFO|nr:leucine-rich repeat-containing protein 31 [Scleropages formosus]